MATVAMRGKTTVTTPRSLYPSLCVTPMTINNVMTAPEWGRESNPPDATEQILCRTSGANPISMYSGPIVFMKIVKPPLAEPVIPAMMLTAQAADASGGKGNEKAKSTKLLKAMTFFTTKPKPTIAAVFNKGIIL